MSEEPVLKVSVAQGSICLLTLNRPQKRNALSVELIERITATVSSAGQDRSLRVLIVLGAGPAFCAGLDLTEAMESGMSEKSAEALSQMYQAIGNSPLITIAAVHGAAMGGGAGLLAACDLVIAADDLRLSYPEVRRGLVAALVTCLLRRQLTDRRVRELILLGQTITAARALEIGLITQIVPPEKLMEAAIYLARSASLGAPGAIARSKRLLDELSPRPLTQDLRLAMQYHLAARNSAEAAEGIAAFLEKREPRWGT